jgi:hypothetical protein
MSHEARHHVTMSHLVAVLQGDRVSRDALLSRALRPLDHPGRAQEERSSRAGELTANVGRK